jgi:hypothetical protein
MKKALLALLLAYCPAIVSRVNADFGPKFASPPRLIMTLEGTPIRGEKYAIAILDASKLSRGQRAENFHGFESSSLPPVEDGRWMATTEGAVHDMVIMPISSGRPFRLAVWLPDRKQAYLSNVVDPHPILNTWYLDLHTDGSAELRRDTTNQTTIDWLILLARHGMLTAFLVTWAVESLVLGVFVARVKPTNPVHLFLRCLLANLLTLPAVWILTVAAMVITSRLESTVIMLGFCELVTVIVEAIAFTSPKAFRSRIAIAYSSLANLASFSAGMLIPLLG